MRVYFHVPDENHPATQTLRHEATRLPQEVRQNWSTSISELFVFLRKPTEKDTVFVLCADTEETLDRYHSMQDRLIDRNIILILPHDGPLTINKGFSLNPRHISNLQSNMKQVITCAARLVGCDVPTTKTSSTPLTLNDSGIRRITAKTIASPHS